MPLRERPDLDRPVPHLIAVVLHQDVTLLQLAEPRDVLELALRDGRLERRAVRARRTGPWCHSASARRSMPLTHDAAHVPFAGRLQRPIRCGEHVVERRRLPLRSDLRVGVPLVVDHLVLVADGRVHVLEDEVLHAAVAAQRDLPVPGQLEVIVGLRRDQIARAARVLAVVLGEREHAVLDAQRVRWHPASCSRASRSSVLPSKSSFQPAFVSSAVSWASRPASLPSGRRCSG